MASIGADASNKRVANNQVDPSVSNTNNETKSLVGRVASIVLACGALIGIATFDVSTGPTFYASTLFAGSGLLFATLQSAVSVL